LFGKGGEFGRKNWAADKPGKSGKKRGAFLKSSRDRKNCLSDRKTNNNEDKENQAEKRA